MLFSLGAMDNAPPTIFTASGITDRQTEAEEVWNQVSSVWRSVIPDAVGPVGGALSIALNEKSMGAEIGHTRYASRHGCCWIVLDDIRAAGVRGMDNPPA